MIAELLIGLPAWVLTVLDLLMILGSLGGLGWLGGRLIDIFAPANAMPPAQPMRTASARQIEGNVAQLWGGATKVTKLRPGGNLRPSYPWPAAPPDPPPKQP